ncbi:hypothetical protein V6N11_022241 [Hibiscus sabdariffa]|uniref:Uncharacterized protein n=1 Tax=Hibiscus sabdariffa TaxID=183260 RepID=A0ABR2TJC4_9ROSI
MFTNRFYIEPEGNAGGLALWWFNEEGKDDVWNLLASLRDNDNDVWCLMGDFNTVSSQEEKIRGNPFIDSQAKAFHNFIEKCRILEMPIKGGAFTWSNLRSDDDAIIEKLDHVLFNLSWSMMLSKTIGCAQPTIGSDHCPIILILRGWPKNLEEIISLRINGCLIMNAIKLSRRLGRTVRKYQADQACSLN